MTREIVTSKRNKNQRILTFKNKMALLETVCIVTEIKNTMGGRRKRRQT